MPARHEQIAVRQERMAGTEEIVGSVVKGLRVAVAGSHRRASVPKSQVPQIITLPVGSTWLCAGTNGKSGTRDHLPTTSFWAAALLDKPRHRTNRHSPTLSLSLSRAYWKTSSQRPINQPIGIGDFKVQVSREKHELAAREWDGPLPARGHHDQWPISFRGR